MNTINTMSEMDKVEASAEAAGAPALKKWMCVLCGFIYDEAVGMPHDGVQAGTRWADVPEDWVCPDCSAGKADFDMTEI